MPTSAEHPIPTETFLLPGQQFCIGLPWERGALPKHGLPVAPKPAKPTGNTLDAEAHEADPIEGLELGPCTVIRRLSPGSLRLLLALREDAGRSSLVVLRKLEAADVLSDEIELHARRVAKLSHPQLARVYPSEAGDEGIFWVSELASGATLSEISAACHHTGKAVPFGLLLSAVHDAALALGALHDEGLSHGLVTDQAVAACFDGGTRLLDAGLFKALARKSTWNEVLDLTGPYLSPEQVLEGRPPDPKCDVFSLAVVLHEALSGVRIARMASFEDRVKAHQNPAPFAPPSRLNIALGKPLDEVMARALSRDRSKRFANGAEFAAALKQASAGFMWSRAQRADWVGHMFMTRRRREEVLVAACGEEKRKRTISSLQIPKLTSSLLSSGPAPSLLTPKSGNGAVASTGAFASLLAESGSKGSSLLTNGSKGPLLKSVASSLLLTSSPKLDVVAPREPAPPVVLGALEDVVAPKLELAPSTVVLPPKPEPVVAKPDRSVRAWVLTAVLALTAGAFFATEGRNWKIRFEPAKAEAPIVAAKPVDALPEHPPLLPEVEAAHPMDPDPMREWDPTVEPELTSVAKLDDEEPAPKPVVKKAPVKRKSSGDELPVPSWLQPKGRKR